MQAGEVAQPLKLVQAWGDLGELVTYTLQVVCAMLVQMGEMSCVC